MQKTLYEKPSGWSTSRVGAEHRRRRSAPPARVAAAGSASHLNVEAVADDGGHGALADLRTAEAAQRRMRGRSEHGRGVDSRAKGAWVCEVESEDGGARGWVCVVWGGHNHLLAEAQVERAQPGAARSEQQEPFVGDEVLAAAHVERLRRRAARKRREGARGVGGVACACMCASP